MNINKVLEGTKLELEITGRLDTITAPELDAEIKQNMDAIDCLVLNFKGVEYISSAGLRVLLATQKSMGKKGKMIVKEVNDTVMEIFNITGFVDILTIE
jgi:anti-sigma B factor antagonist